MGPADTTVHGCHVTLPFTHTRAPGSKYCELISPYVHVGNKTAEQNQTLGLTLRKQQSSADTQPRDDDCPTLKSDTECTTTLVIFSNSKLSTAAVDLSLGVRLIKFYSQDEICS
eukprot:scpid8234/ scgid32757/ 